MPHTETAICTAESMDLPASSGAVSDFSAGKQEVLQNEIEGDHNHEHASEDISGASSGDDDDDDDNDTSIGEDNDDVPTENIEAVIRGSEGSLFRSHISEVEEEGFSLFDEDSFPILLAARGIGLESGTIFGGIAGGGCETHVDADVGVESLDGQDTESLPASVIAWSSASENATTAKMPSEVLPPSSAPTSVSTPAKLVSWASVAKAPARPAVAIAPATRPQSVWGMKSTAVTSTASTSLGGGVGGLADWSALIREAAATGSGSEVPLPVAAATSSQTNLAGAWSSTATSAGSTHFGETMKSTVPTSAAKAVTTFSSEPQLPSRILSSSGSGPQASQRAAMEDDGEGWIHTANINVARAHGGGLSLSKPVTKHPSQLDGGTGGKAGSSKSRGAKAAAATPAAEVEPAKTACFTTDFSIQNVLIQMGLNVMSADGMLLQKVKQFVLRCIGCYHVHYDMDRLFCSQCGGSSLSRVGATVDSKSGEMRLHLKANYRPCLKGKIFSLPKPGSRGRYDGDFLLREDQLLSGIWKQKSQQIRKDIRSAFGEDVTGDVGLHINKSAGIKVSSHGD